jgi:hypothetical protein
MVIKRLKSVNDAVSDAQESAAELLGDLRLE